MIIPSGLGDFENGGYGSQYPAVGASNHPEDDAHDPNDPQAQMRATPYMPYQHQQPYGHDDVGNFAYQQHSQDPSLLASSGSGSVLPSHVDGLQPLQTPSRQMRDGEFPGLPSSLISFDLLSGAGTSIPMSMGMDASGNAFPYHATSAYAPSAAGLEHPSHTQALNLDHPTLYSTPSLQNTSWTSQNNGGNGAPNIAGVNTSSDYTQPIAPTQNLPPVSQSSDPAPSQRPLQPRPIQPKGPSPRKDMSSSSNASQSGIGIEPSPYANIYSNSGFDIMSVLASVVSRPNPKINIGAVDLSCAFVLCDVTLEDHPIVYVSEAFERLTGYTRAEIVNRNCRFLQSPEGLISQGAQRTFVDEQTAFRLRSTIEERAEIQASLINYRKGGQPFMNLITMIPIKWNSEHVRFYVGFQVDLVEKPDAVTKRNENGTYMINYQRTQLPNYVVPPRDAYGPDFAAPLTNGNVSLVLNGLDEDLESPYRQFLERVVVENTDDIIHVLSFDGEFLYLSPSCKKVLEYDSIELVGKTLSTICHPSDIGTVIRDLRACTTRDPVSVVYRIRKKRSGYIWFESHGSWHISPDRGRRFLVMVGRERPVCCLDQLTKVRGESLAETDLWVKLSMSGIILFISSKSRPVLGRTPEDLIGKGLQDLTTIESRPEIQRALDQARSGQQNSFALQIRHRKGHMILAEATLCPGDTKEGMKPTFLIAQVHFPRPQQPPTTNQGPILADTAVAVAPGQHSLNFTALLGSNRLPAGNQYVSTLRNPTVFTELTPTRGSSWQIELRELEKQNRTLHDELQRLLTRKKKRKRKQNAAPVEKICAMCQTRSTPEWRRGPSGSRDLCNSCGLRWAKQIRNAERTAVPA